MKSSINTTANVTKQHAVTSSKTDEYQRFQIAKQNVSKVFYFNLTLFQNSNSNFFITKENSKLAQQHSDSFEAC